MVTSGIPNRTALTWELVSRSGIVVVFVLLFTTLAFTVPGSVSNRSIQGLLLSVILIGPTSVTMMFVLALGGVDLPVTSTVALTGVVASTSITATHNVVFGVGVGVLAGGLVRLVNGMLVACYQINLLIVIFAMMEVMHGLTFITPNDDAVMISEERLFNLDGRLFLGISYPIWSNIVGSILFGSLLKKAVFGKNVLVVGGNEEVALPAGLPVARIKIAVFILQGLVTGLVGVMLASRMSLGDPETSVELELGVISTHVPSGVSLTGEVATVSGVLVGALTMGPMQNTMSLISVPAFHQYLIRGGTLLLAAWSDRIHRNE